jgi:L-ascorbate metabolism protein UlaG (beta-lactamase superfamily)
MRPFFVLICAMLFLIILLVVGIFIFRLRTLSGPQYKGPVSDHFDGKKFKNPTGIPAKGLADVFKWMMTRQRKKWTEKTGLLPGKRPLDHFNDGIRITFVNHSTFLIQVDGLNILTDPVWSRRVSPYTWAGPKRTRPPGIRMDDLPRIDLILLSHNHYDHLDMRTLQILNGGHHPQFITPLGVGALLETNFIRGSTDLDWWQEKSVSNKLVVSCVPAQHFSGRGMSDRDATLWCGYVLQTTFGNIYFAGDTGYNDKTFVEIGTRFERMKVSLIPIGAYKPQWFMGPIHVSPEQAVTIHQEVRSEKSIGCHFGTFPLADEGPDDPVEDLAHSLTRQSIPRDQFITLTEGESIVI